MSAACKQRIAEKAVGVDVVVLNIFELLFVRGHALQPTERRDHGKEQVQFRVFGQARLDKERGLGGVEPAGQPVRDHLPGVLAQVERIFVARRQHVPVGDEVKAVVFILQLHPILESAHQVAQMEFARGPHTTQNARALRSVRDSSFAFVNPSRFCQASKGPDNLLLPKFR